MAKIALPILCLGLVIARFTYGDTATPAQAANQQPLPSPQKPAVNISRPLNIAHRGASGELPEETVEAWTRAIDEGADFIECDVVLTKDCVPICRHEPNLIATTNARSIFPQLVRNLSVDGVNQEGVWSTDLTLADMKKLSAIQARDFRDPSYDSRGLKVPTFVEYLDVAKAADRVVGIYPETKHPTWFDTQSGLTCANGTISDIVLDALTSYGYRGPINSPAWNSKPVFIQSFEVENLRDLHSATDIPLVQLLDSLDKRTADTNQTYAELSTPTALADIATYAAGIGPYKENLVARNASTNYLAPLPPSDIVQNAHALGMQVHTWTMRNENQYLAWNYSGDPWEEYDLFYKTVGVDGIFTDFPGTQAAYLRAQGYVPLAEQLTNPAVVQSYSVETNQPAVSQLQGSADEAEKQDLCGTGLNPNPPVVPPGAKLMPVEQLLPGDRPWIVGHRGLPGVFPDHTLEGYQAAIDAGAHFVECDAVVTKDKQLVCRHEPNLNGTTNAWEFFKDRARSYVIDGVNTSGIFSIDLTLAEVKMLGAKQPFDFRNQAYNGLFKVPTVDEYMALIKGANRTVGIYVETKHPTFFDTQPFMQGTTMSDMLLDAMTKQGYKGPMCSPDWNKQPVFIESFETQNLRMLKSKTDIPLVFLLGAITADTGLTVGQMTTDAMLADIATYAVGFGPWKPFLVPPTPSGYLGLPTGLTRRAQRAGMMLHPYTFRAEEQFLTWTDAQDERNELAYFLLQERVNGLFTDYANIAVSFLNDAIAAGYTFDVPNLPANCRNPVAFA